MDTAPRADDYERTLGDIIDVKAGVLLVVITFLAGISSQLIAFIAGWETRSMVDRYFIVSERDLREAAFRMERSPHTRRIHP